MIELQQSSITQDSFVAEYSVLITRAEVSTGAHRTMHFYGPDGHERSVEVEIPAGSVTGTRVRSTINAHQHPSEQIVAVVTVLPHQRWETRGDDLILHLQIDRPSAIREGTLQVAIGNGRTIAVPVNRNQNHARYIYAGYGMPRSYNTQRNGDLIVQLELVDLSERTSAPTSDGRSWWRSLFGRR